MNEAVAKFNAQVEEADIDEDFPLWYENYAEGIPELGVRWRNILNDMHETHPYVMREQVCLVAAFVLGYRDLVHDISQTMFDQMGGAQAPRDEAMRIALDAMYELTTTRTIEIGDHPSESQLKYAVSVALNPQWEPSDTPPEAEIIRDLVGIVRAVGTML